MRQIFGPQTDPDRPNILAPGTVIMTDEEKNTFEKLGWKAGDPIPADFPKMVRMALEEANLIADDANTPASPLPLDTPPIQVQTPIMMDRLPAAKKAELAQALAEAKQQWQAFEQRQQAVPTQAAPGVHDAIREIQRAAPPPAAKPRPINITAANVPPPPPPPQAASATSIADADRQAKPTVLPPWPAASVPPPSSPPPPPPPQPPPAAETAKPAAATASTTQPFCPFCGFDMSLPDPRIHVDPQDKIRFVVAIRGGQRFRKEYQLLDGSVTFRFRDQTVEEVDLARRQISADIYRDTESRQISTQTEYEGRLLLYMALLALEHSSTSTHGKEIQPLADWKIGQPGGPPRPEAPDTPLKVYVDSLLAHVITSETMRHLLVTTYRDFNGTIQQLEVHSRDPNFYKVTIQPS
jgi:hypothetical protein